MDLTVLCGSPFASIIYVTYYNSKLDKKADIRDILQKLKTLDKNTDTKIDLLKVLTTMDTFRATSLPEVSSNLFFYRHRYTSSKILRLETRYYLSKDESFENETSETLNSLLYDLTKEKEEFELPCPNHSTTHSAKTFYDNITLNYFYRPEVLYSATTEKMINSRQMSIIH